MTRYILFLFIFISCLACNSRHTPDVSNIKVSLITSRFEKDFFAMDTLHIAASLDKLQHEYGDFLNDYLYNILMLQPHPDTAAQKVKQFIHQYKPIYDSVQQKFATTTTIEKELKQSLQYLQYYFPAYKAPTRLITFVGPIEGYGNVLTHEGFAVGLQMYMGQNFSVYQEDYIREVYPDYISRRFEPAYIATNCMRNIIDDMYPYKDAASPLMEQMIELGKRLYLLDLLLPNTADSIKTGYTQRQLDGCYKNEAMIWNFFVKNDLLYSADPSVMRDYLADGPKTEILGDAAPGAIGQFVGWQIVKKWIEKNDTKTPAELMNIPAKQIYEEAKYKPR